MSGLKYEVYVDGSKQFRWRLRAANGKIIADCAEGYHNEADCRHGIELVKGSSGAPVERAKFDMSILADIIRGSEA